MNRNILLAVIGLSSITLSKLTFSVEKVNAANVTLNGNWESSDYSPSVSPDPFSGLWELTYDDSGITNSGFDVIDNIPLTKLILQPTNLIGSTVYNTTNSLGRIVFFNGSINSINIGGIPNGANGIGGGNTDDFQIGYTGLTKVVNRVILANVGLTNGEATNFSGTFDIGSLPSIESVPEPSTILGLLTIGGILLGASKRKE